MGKIKIRGCDNRYEKEDCALLLDNCQGITIKHRTLSPVDVTTVNEKCLSLKQSDNDLSHCKSEIVFFSPPLTQ